MLQCTQYTAKVSPTLENHSRPAKCCNHLRTLSGRETLNNERGWKDTGIERGRERLDELSRKRGESCLSLLEMGEREKRESDN